MDEGQPEEQLESILLEPLHHGSLTQVYRQILSVSFKDPSATVLEGFRNVTDTIILAKISLRRQDIVHLLDMKLVTLDHICRGLQSVLDTEDLLRFTHLSFVDFLIDSRGCHPPFLFHSAIQLRTLLLISARHENHSSIQHMQVRNIAHTLVHDDLKM
jgi:hypothetical protein